MFVAAVLFSCFVLCKLKKKKKKIEGNFSTVETELIKTVSAIES